MESHEQRDDLQRDDLRNIFLSETPLMDVRAPVEFAQGAFPHTVNLPLMNDAERHAVGIRYKEAGQDSAIELGHELVCGPTKEARVQAWLDFTKAHPTGALYCFRGGLRSQISQQWLRDAGVAYPRIKGGYKAMRNFLLEELEASAQKTEYVVVGGLTGSGKTDIIEALTNTIDLEGLAHHRGSSFGGHPDQQPSQIDFENALSIALMRKQHAGVRSLVVEDEGQLIGRCAVPMVLRDHTRRSPMVWVVEPVPTRVARIERDYIRRLLSEYEQRSEPGQAFAHFAIHLTRSLQNLRKRLGLERYAVLAQAMEAALRTQERTGCTEDHRTWIEPLIVEYYDPMYTWQRSQRDVPTLFEGDCTAVTEYLKARGY